MHVVADKGKQCGFALIELAVVLLILSVLLGLGLSAINAQRTKAGYEKTFAHRDAIKTALENFLRVNKRLPCPSNPGNDGSEANGGAGGACNPGVVAGRTNYGIVPWRTLGLERSDALDGWDTYFSYMVSDTAGASDWIAPAGISSSATGALTKRETDPVAPPATIDTANYAVAIISHGPNTRGGFTEKLIANSTAGATVEENDNLGATANRFFAGVPTPNFDDVVVGVTATELTGELIAADVLPGPLEETRELVRNVFDQAVGDTIAGKASGTAGTDCISTTLPCYRYNVQFTGAATDVWGRAVVVTATGILTETTTATTTTGIQVQSWGPDGNNDACAAGKDDICRSVTAVELRGLLGRASGFN